MNVDDRLRRELRGLSPADPSGAFDRVVEKRIRRRIVRRIRITGVAFVVIVGSMAGFYGLTRVFGSTGGGPLAGPANGLIAFSDIKTNGFGPDGARVLDDWHIYTMTADGQQVTRIGPDNVDEALYPTWSPDGSRIAFVGFSGDPPQGAIYVANGDGSDAHEVFAANDLQQVEGLRWSPDGSRIGYELVQGVPPSSRVGSARWTIWTMAPDGSNQRQLTTTGREMHFSWSPDGEQIVFDRFEEVESSNLADAKSDLFIVNADGTGEMRLTDDGESRDPGWSPDGTLIAFKHGPWGAQSVSVIGVDGSGLTSLASEGTSDAGISFPYGNSLAWSPDGTQIAFFGRVPANTCHISTLNVETGVVHQLLSSPDTLGCPGQEGMSWGISTSTEVAPTSTATPEPSQESPIPSASSSDETVTDIGLGFPVCNVSSVRGDFAGDGTSGTAWVATKVSDDGGCPEATQASNVLAVDLNGDGVADTSYGPLDCGSEISNVEFRCRAFAAPDLDHDGIAEVAVAVGSTEFGLWALGGSELTRLGYDCSRCNSGRFLWGGPGGHEEGAYCLAEAAAADFVEWDAERTDDGGRYALAEFFIDLKGPFLVQIDRRDSFVPYDPTALPPGGGDDFCGSPSATSLNETSR